MTNAATPLSNRSKLRFGAGFLMAPLVAGALTFLIFLGQWYYGLNVFPTTPYSDPVDGAAALASGVTVIAFIATFGAAVPVVSVMSRRGSLSLRHVLILGAIIGQAPFALIVAAVVIVQTLTGSLSEVARLWGGVFGTVRAITLGVLIGVPSAGVFWLIGVRGSEFDRVRLTAKRREPERKLGDS